MAEVQDSKEAFRSALFWSLVIVGAISLIFVFESALGMSWYWLGVKPRAWAGLLGILTSPVKHHDIGHLLNNMLLLEILLVGYYLHVPTKQPLRKLLLISLIANLWLWIGGRDAWHYGASGVVYGLFFYLLVVSIKGRIKELYLFVFSCLLLSAGFFIGLFPVEETVSFEGHLFGSLSGIMVALSEKRIKKKKVPASNVTLTRDASFHYQYKENKDKQGTTKNR